MKRPFPEEPHRTRLSIDEEVLLVLQRSHIGWMGGKGEWNIKLRNYRVMTKERVHVLHLGISYQKEK